MLKRDLNIGNKYQYNLLPLLYKLNFNWKVIINSINNRVQITETLHNLFKRLSIFYVPFIVFKSRVTLPLNSQPDLFVMDSSADFFYCLCKVCGILIWCRHKLYSLQNSRVGAMSIYRMKFCQKNQTTCIYILIFSSILLLVNPCKIVESMCESI